MIVIAIIGVLAATLLPRLQGAQERSRDSWRITALKSTAAVLEVYFSDNGQYPVDPADAVTDAAGTAWPCLSTADGSVGTHLSGIMKWGKAPLDPIRANTAAPCGIAWAFWYKALEWRSGITNNAYIIVANVEAFQKANFDNSTAADIAAATIYGDITLTESGLTAEPATWNWAHSIYIERS